MRRPPRSLLGLAALVLGAISASRAARADVIYLVDDDIVEGRITAEDASTISVDLEEGNVTIDRSRVLKIVRKPFERRAPAPRAGEGEAARDGARPPAPVTATPSASADRESVASERGRVTGGAGPDALVAQAAKEIANGSLRVRSDWEERLFLLGDAAAEPVARELADARSGADARVVLAGVLGRLRVPATLPVLASATADEDFDVAAAAVDAIGAFGERGRPSVAVLEKLIGEESRPPALRALAAQSLGRLGDPDVLPSLIMELNTQDAALRANAARAIVALSGRPVDEFTWSGLMTTAEGNGSKAARVDAAGCLAALADERTVGELIDLATRAQADDVTGALLHGIARVGGERGRAFLLSQMLGARIEVRVAACAATPELPEGDLSIAVPFLIEALGQTSEVAAVAGSALRTITGQDLPPQRGVWREYWAGRARTGR